MLCLTSLTRTFNTMLNKSSGRGQPCLVPESFQAFTIEYDVDCALVIYWLRYVPSMATFCRVFIVNGCWILSKAFSASVEMIMWFFSQPEQSFQIQPHIIFFFPVRFIFTNLYFCIKQFSACFPTEYIFYDSILSPYWLIIYTSLKFSHCPKVYKIYL